MDTAYNAVEVRFSRDGASWYNAYLEDVEDGGNVAVCSFDDDAVPQTSFRKEDVRMPLGSVDPSFDPGVGNLVEIKVNRTESSPSGWRLAQIKSRARGMFYVAPTERLKGARDEAVVTRSCLRPSRREASGFKDPFVKAEMALDPRQDVWVKSPSAVSMVSSASHLAVQAFRGSSGSSQGCLKIQLVEGKTDVQVEPPKIVMVGTEGAVDKAWSLMQPVAKHNLMVLTFKNAMEIRDKALEEREKRMGGTSGDIAMPAKFTKEFEASPAAVARLIGRKGSNIRTLESVHGVKITVSDGASAYGEQKTVTISGDDEESVQAALDNSQQLEETLDVPAHMNGWVTGRGNSTLSELQLAAGLQACRLDRDAQQLVFLGTRTACDQARELFGAHMLYFDTFKELDERIDELVTQLKARGNRERIDELAADFVGTGSDRGEEDEGKGGSKGKGYREGEKGSKAKGHKGKGKDKGMGKGPKEATRSPPTGRGRAFL
mmetsp:Transcript_108690/g.346530  ORF Transcript_108690/g.346530 Transcript_108690/m.346530 type:complete len:490 (-) Transcript_108690:51-1520(-)